MDLASVKSAAEIIITSMTSVKSAAEIIITSRMICTVCFMGLFIGSGLRVLLPLLSWRVPRVREVGLVVGWLL